MASLGGVQRVFDELPNRCVERLARIVEAGNVLVLGEKLCRAFRSQLVGFPHV